MKSDVRILDCDILVIGGGAAGCRAAIETSTLGANTLLVDKGIFGHSGASGVIPNWLVSSVAPGDSPKRYFADHMKASGFLANQKLAKILSEEIRDRLLELEAYGNIFVRGNEGACAPMQVGGHSTARTYGPAYAWMMCNEVRRRGVEVLEETMITELLRQKGRVVGGFGVSKKTGELLVIKAKSTILATGGAGQVYGVPARMWRSTSPIELTGDGYAMAYRAGAELVDMEFTQFTLGTLYQPEDRGESATLPGTVLSQARVKRSETTLRSVPASHHFMGGVVVDEKAQTTVPGLHACGEVAGGIHSSSRLESNALADCLVFGRRAGEAAAREASTVGKPNVDRDQVELKRREVLSLLESKGAGGVRPHEIRANLSDTMWNLAGEVKDAAGLASALAELEKIKSQLPRMHVTSRSRVFNPEWFEALENFSLVLTAEMVLRASMFRRESRGDFRRKDYPKTDDKNFLVNIYIKQVDGKMEVYAKPTLTLENHIKNRSIQKNE